MEFIHTEGWLGRRHRKVTIRKSREDRQEVKLTYVLYLNTKNFSAIMRQGNTKGLEEMEGGLRQQSVPENL